MVPAPGLHNSVFPRFCPDLLECLVRKSHCGPGWPWAADSFTGYEPSRVRPLGIGWLGEGASGSLMGEYWQSGARVGGGQWTLPQSHTILSLIPTQSTQTSIPWAQVADSSAEGELSMVDDRVLEGWDDCIPLPGCCSVQGSADLGMIASVGGMEEGLSTGTLLAVPLTLSLEPHTPSLLE